MTHEESKQRRQQIANSVRNGVAIAQAASQHGVAINTVYAACREHGVTYPKPTRGGHSGATLRIIAALQNTEATCEEIAEREGITKQRVHAILVDASRHGIKFARAKNKRRASQCDS